MPKRFIPLIFLVLLVFQCTEPIDLKFGNTDVSRIVVDGYITDSLRRHEIKLSYTSGFNQNGVFEPAPIVTAIVRIIDDQGIEIVLDNLNNGSYLTPLMRAAADRSYQIRVQLEDARFESELYGLPEGEGDLSLSYEPEIRSSIGSNGLLFERKGVRVDARLNNVAPSSFFRWELQRHYIGEAYDATHVYCYIRDFDEPEVDIFRTSVAFSNSDQELIHTLDFIERSYRFKHDYAIVAKQLIMDQGSYEYWNRVDEQITNVGSLFDSAPTSLTGNVRNTESGTAVLGYFGVYKESIGRVFFNQNELPFGFIDYECPSVPPLPLCSDCLAYPGLEAFPWHAEERYWWRCILIGDSKLSGKLPTVPVSECD